MQPAGLVSSDSKGEKSPDVSAAAAAAGGAKKEKKMCFVFAVSFLMLLP